MVDIRKVESPEGLTLNQLSEIVLHPDVYNDLEYKHFKLESEDGVFDVVVNNRKYATRTVRLLGKYGPFYKDQVLLKEQVADDWSHIPITSCRCCKKENVKPYQENYFENYNDFYTLFNFNNGYCKECAEKKQNTKHPVPQVLKEWWIREASYSVGGEKFIFRTAPDGTVYYYKPEKVKATKDSQF